VSLHVDMFAHNKSGSAYQDENRRPETITFEVSRNVLLCSYPWVGMSVLCQLST
jgi:hypothetical protein